MNVNIDIIILILCINFKIGAKEVDKKGDLNLSANERRVLKEIFNNKLITRTEIAKLTNTNKATITSVLNNLKEKQIVNEVGEGKSSKIGGRKPILLEVNPNFGYTVSIDFTYDSVEIMYNLFNGKIISHNSYKLVEKNMDNAIHILQENLNPKNNKGTINGLLGIAVSVHGVVNLKQEVESLPFLDLNNISIKDALKNIADVPIVIENEANLAALYEYSIHSDNLTDNLLTLSIHKGIGAGLIFNKTLYRGSDGRAGEIGKSLVLLAEENGMEYKRIEEICSQDAIIDRISTRLGYKVGILEVKEKFSERNSVVNEEIDFFINRISILIYNLCMQINPETIYINCPIITLIPNILEKIKNKCNQQPLFNTKLNLTSNVEFATLFGGALAIKQKILELENIKLDF